MNDDSIHKTHNSRKKFSPPRLEVPNFDAKATPAASVNHRPGPPAHARPKQLLRAFFELKARMERGLDHEVCLTQIGALTKTGEPAISISQIGARVHELCSPEIGCKIESRLLPGHHMHTYLLISYPDDIIKRIENYRAKKKAQQRQLPFTESTPRIGTDSAGRYMRATGKPRPSTKRSTELPLYPGVLT